MGGPALLQAGAWVAGLWVPRGTARVCQVARHHRGHQGQCPMALQPPTWLNSLLCAAGRAMGLTWQASSGQQETTAWVSRASTGRWVVQQPGYRGHQLEGGWWLAWQARYRLEAGWLALLAAGGRMPAASGRLPAAGGRMPAAGSPPPTHHHHRCLEAGVRPDPTLVVGGSPPRRPPSLPARSSTRPAPTTGPSSSASMTAGRWVMRRAGGWGG